MVSHSPNNGARNLNALLEAALASNDPLEVELHARSIALDPAPDDRRQSALLEILKARPTTNNVVSTCLFHLRAFGPEPLRKGIHRVLGEPDGADSEPAKISALVRLVALEEHNSADALLIGTYAFHSQPTLRAATIRGLRGLDFSQKQRLLEANSTHVLSGHKNGKALELLIRSLLVDGAL